MLLVRKLRLTRGWSQVELAEFSGLSVRTVQRIERGAKPGLDSLKALAAVFDMEASDFQQEEDTMTESRISIDEKRALKHVRKLKDFYINLCIYGVVITGLFVINLVTAPEYIWAKWPAIGWGIGMLVHGLSVHGVLNFFGPDWEKRQVEKHLGRDLS